MAVAGRKLLVALGGAVVVIFAIIAVPTISCRGDAPHLDDYGELPKFTLTDQSGQPYTDASMRGHPTIVSFLFTRCDTICPITTGKMTRLQAITAGQPIQLLSFSIDPGYDTPDKLAAYAQKYSADPARWRFVTGQPDEVKQLIEGPFMTTMDREGDRPTGAPNIVHRGYFMLVDGTLRIRGVFDSNDPLKLDELVRDAQYLAQLDGSTTGA